MYEEQVPSQIRTQETGRRYDVDPSIHKWLFNPKDIITEVEKSLRGQTYDRKEHKWVQVRKPILNDDGINSVLLNLSPYASKVFSMSHLSEKRIKKMAHQFTKEMIVLFGTDEHDELGIDVKQMSVIIKLVSNVVYSTLRKAYEGLSLGVIRDTEKGTEIRTLGKPGGLSGIFRKIRGGG